MFRTRIIKLAENQPCLSWIKRDYEHDMAYVVYNAEAAFEPPARNEKTRRNATAQKLCVSTVNCRKTTDSTARPSAVRFF